MSEPSNKHKLGAYTHCSQHQAQHFEDCLHELFRRVEKLEFRADCLASSTNASILGIYAKLKDIPQSEGHPIPDYDYKPENVGKILQAIFGGPTDDIAGAELDLVDAALDYCDFYQSFNINKPMGEKELREWGEKSCDLHAAMIAAAKKLSDL